MRFSRAKTPHSFWLKVDKKRSSRARWYNYISGKAVPRANIVQRIESEVPDTASVFNALFWSVLKGIPVSQEEVERELVVLTKAYSGPHKLLQMGFWMSAVEDNPEKFEWPAIRTIFESRTGEDFLQLTILIMALAESNGNKSLWNYMCGTYRKILPLYIPTIPWPFKNEVFDELDKYVQEWVHSGVSRKSLNRDWRDSLPQVHEGVKYEYVHILDLAFMDHRIDLTVLPAGFIDQIAEKLATEFCKSEDFMLYSWHLCDPISLDVAKAIKDIQFYHDGDITVDRIISYLNSQGYFDNTCSGYEAYAKFAHIEEYHLNFFP